MVYLCKYSTRWIRRYSFRSTNLLYAGLSLYASFLFQFFITVSGALLNTVASEKVYNIHAVRHWTLYFKFLDLLWTLIKEFWNWIFIALFLILTDFLSLKPFLFILSNFWNVYYTVSEIIEYIESTMLVQSRLWYASQIARNKNAPQRWPRFKRYEILKGHKSI